MFLGGLWHGAAWSYAVWGTAHGMALAVERAFGKKLVQSKVLWVVWLRRLIVFTFVTLAWLLFKLPSFDHVVMYVQSMVGNLGKNPDIKNLYYILLYSMPVVLYHLVYLWGNKSWKERLEPIALGVMLFLILFNSGSAGSFIYFQF